MSLRYDLLCVYPRGRPQKRPAARLKASSPVAANLCTLADRRLAIALSQDWAVGETVESMELRQPRLLRKGWLVVVQEFAGPSELEDITSTGTPFPTGRTAHCFRNSFRAPTFLIHDHDRSRPSFPCSPRLECRHFFHSSCLLQYLNNNSVGAEPLCPICRARIPWHPSAGIKPKPTGDGNNSDDNHNSNIDNNNRQGANDTSPPRPNNPPADHAVGLVPGANVPTPDSFSRAARGADSVVRLLRHMVQVWGNEVELAREAANAANVAGGTGARAGDARGARTPEGLRRDARAASDNPSSSDGGIGIFDGATSGGGGGGTGGAGGSSPAIEAVAQQLLEIFPELSRQVALRRARMARGSIERAVELCLEPIATPVGEGGAADGSSGTFPPSQARAAAGGVLGRPGASAGLSEATLRRRWWQ